MVSYKVIIDSTLGKVVNQLYFYLFLRHPPTFVRFLYSQTLLKDMG